MRTLITTALVLVALVLGGCGAQVFAIRGPGTWEGAPDYGYGDGTDVTEVRHEVLIESNFSSGQEGFNRWYNRDGHRHW